MLTIIVFVQYLKNAIILVMNLIQYQNIRVSPKIFWSNKFIRFTIEKFTKSTINMKSTTMMKSNEME